MEEIRRSLHVDDILSGGETVQQARERKEAAVTILEDATFSLHKWASNESELEDKPELPTGDEDQTAAKIQLGVAPTESKILGMPWNKRDDTLSVQMTQEENCVPTKRETLRHLAKVYDPLGLASPLTLVGKIIYRDICDAKFPWDTELDGALKSRWLSWKRMPPDMITVPRPIAPHQEQIRDIQLHGFGDASNQGVCAVVYALAKQDSGSS